jgi:hypothetical protein
MGTVLSPCSPFLKKGVFVCLRWLYRECPCDIFMYVYIITEIDLSPSFLSFLS